jgi:calcium-dependent protein kinase
MNLANLLKTMTVTQGNITKDYWVKTPPMGKSDIGEIREVIHKNLKRRNILKILYLNMFSDKEVQMILNEIKISQQLSHPNVLEMMEYNYDNQNIYIIMEYFQGKSLSLLTSGRNLEERIRSGKLTDEVTIYNIFKEIVSLVIYLHRENIVHRDLRLNNILFDGKKVKIDDFQKAKELKPFRYLSEITGNPFYVAPEILNGKYNQSIDVWALGVILYHMVFLKYPFAGKNTEDTVNKIQNQDFYPDYNFNSKTMTVDSKVEGRSNPKWKDLSRLTRTAVSETIPLEPTTKMSLT